jgi:acylphosphatase
VNAPETPSQVSNHRCTCYFSGRVQGVGFRYTVQNLAISYNVLGYVRNLDDGRVEMVVEGPSQETQLLIDALKRKMQDYINRTVVTQSPATGEFQCFSIRHY